MYKCENCGYEISNNRYNQIFDKEGVVLHNCLQGGRGEMIHYYDAEIQYLE